MAKPTGSPPQPLCPKCGKPVVKAGTSTAGKQRYGHGPRTTRRDCTWQGTNPINVEAAAAAGVDQDTATAIYKRVKSARGIRRYVITAAQNATPVYAPFLKALLGYCKANDAQLLVIPYRYKNVTSVWSQKAEDDDWWAPELHDYLLDKRTSLNKNLVILADIKTQPTASRPLQGFETVEAGKSCIIGHTKIELTTVASPHKSLPKVLTSTGTVTQPNYIPSKAGKKAEHHHTFGACFVEIDGDTFHMRQLNAVRDGSFMDLQHEYTAAGMRPIKGEGALVLGDAHVRFIDAQAVSATFGKKGIVDTLKPKHLVWHDVFDCNAQNHHDDKKVFVKLAKYKAGMHNIEAELDEALAFVDRHTRPGTVNVFVSSNHPNEHLERWMNECDPRKDPENCVFWAKTFQVMSQSARMGSGGAEYIDPFNYWAAKKLKTVSQARLLSTDEGFTIHGIECGFHGHQGLNGARGSRSQYTKIGVKSVIGHSHSPGICDGVYQTGTFSHLRLAYNHGPSSWMHTHCYIYPNGKRTLINVIDGKWRAA